MKSTAVKIRQVSDVDNETGIVVRQNRKSVGVSTHCQTGVPGKEVCGRSHAGKRKGNYRYNQAENALRVPLSSMLKVQFPNVVRRNPPSQTRCPNTDVPTTD